MIGFLFAAALLLALALFFVVRPLLGKRADGGDVSHGATNVSIYRDQLRELEGDLENGAIDRLQYEAARREIERRVLEESEEESEQRALQRGAQWRLAWVTAAAVPVIAIPMYLLTGEPVALDPTRVAAIAAAEGGDQHALTPERIMQMVGQLEERLKKEPGNVDGWVMLARSKMALDRPAEAVEAYRQAVKLLPDNAQLLADFADTLALAQGRSLKGEPEQVVARALRADPNNVKALALSGTIAFQNQNFELAATQWQKVLGFVEPGSDFAQRIQASIDEARARGGLPATAPVAARPPAAKSAPAQPGASAVQSAAAGKAVSGGGTLRGRVSLAAAAQQALAANDTVFVFARAAEGPRMPLAILRLQVRDLPADFELTEAMAMSPGMSIAQFPELVVAARVSKTGSATPAAGDWESAPIPVALGASGLRVVIDTRRP